MPQTGSELDLLTLAQAAEFSPYSADYLNLLARKGKIKATKIGRDWLITKADLFEYLRKQQTESKNRVSVISKYLNFLM